MLEKIKKWLLGYVIIHVKGREYSRFLNLCTKNNILLWSVAQGEEFVSGKIYNRDLKKLNSYAQKANVEISVENKIGLPHLMYRYKKRKIFFLCIFFLIVAVYSFTLFIWDIKVNGETVYTKEQILRDIKDNYVKFGTQIKDVDCGKLEEELREKYDKIAWISCEIKGTQLIVNITETIEPNLIEMWHEPCNIVAVKDGIVTDIIVRSGIKVTEKATEVKKGDILVTGAVNIYNDYDEYIETNYVVADADVYGIVKYNYCDTFSMNYYEKEYTGNKKKYYELMLGDKMYGIFDKDSKYINEDIFVYDKKIKLGEYIYFPFTIKKTVIKEYEPVAKIYTAEDAKKKAREKINIYIDNLKKKGVEILENNVTINIENDKCTAKGTIVTKELIGVPEKLNIIEQGEEP